MDHSEAIKLEAIERYVLGDLSVSEVEEFERHFFDCPQCSEELRTMSILQDSARAAYIEHGPGPFTASLPAAGAETVRAGWWRAWRMPQVLVPALAGLVLACLAGYEAGGLNLHTGTPQPVSEYALYAASRGDLAPVVPPKGAQFYTLYMDRTWEREYSHYRAAFVDDPGGGTAAQLKPARYSISLPAPGLGRELHVLIPVHALPAGRYVLVIYGQGDVEEDSGKETEVARYPFSLRFE
jgi:hypothetical protein